MEQLSFFDLITDSTNKKLSTVKTGLDILSCGAGMQSTALILMSCENKQAFLDGKTLPHPRIPIYDIAVFCDLDKEPDWVYKQVNFIQHACEKVGIPFIILAEGDGYGKSLYNDYMNNFGIKSVRSIPFWTLTEEIDEKTGEVKLRKGKMPRVCTMDYKIDIIQKYIKREVLGYNLFERLKVEDRKAHRMHIGFSFEERSRCKPNPNPMFENVFLLVDLKLERKHNYAYIRDFWGLETRASACLICPFHTNYFFSNLKHERPSEYQDVIAFDSMLEVRQPMSKITSKLYISKSRKRISELTPQECNDQECFEYRGMLVGNGF